MAGFLGFAWDAWVVAGVFALLILAASWGYYTRTGSGIDEHPVDDRAGSPGARGTATVSGEGRVPEAPEREAVATHRDKP
jgi:hypothetical protein